MSAILIPEVAIYNLLESIVKLLRKNLKEQQEEKQSILYKILGEDDDNKPIKINTYAFFNQAKNVLLRTNGIKINFGYNMEVAKDISFHIILPSETSDPAPIGNNNGYLEEESTEEKHTNSFNSTYQIMITSNNASEVTTMYHLLKAMLVSLSDQVELLGLQNATISGNDIVFQDDKIPVNIFHKVLNISFKYEVTVSNQVKKDIAKGFIFEYKAIESLNNETNQL